MALMDRFKTDFGDSSKIPVHGFSAAIQLLADGDITRQAIIDRWSLTVQDEDQLDQLAAVYNAKASAVAKLAYLVKIHNVLLAYEAGLTTKAQAASYLELT